MILLVPVFAACELYRHPIHFIFKLQVDSTIWDSVSGKWGFRVTVW